MQTARKCTLFFMLISALLASGCAQSLWIVKDYETHSGKIRYLDAEDRAHALGQAALWCDPGKPKVIREGHYQSLLVSGPITARETPFMFIEFICE